MDGTFGSQFSALSLVKSQYVHTILDQSWELLHRGVHPSVRFPLQYCLDTNRCPPLKDAVNYLVGVHCSWLCQWSIYYRLSAESALCHLLDLAALTWRLLFICLELGHNSLLITKQGHMILQSLSHLSFPFVSSPGSESIGTTQLFLFRAASLLFRYRYPHRHQLCADSCVRQFSLFGLILLSASDLGLPKHTCRKWSHLSQIFLFCVELLLTNFSLEIRLDSWINHNRIRRCL